ncbi:hypothetical protein EVAR_8271_1 [Eumeta japonica]|uniref:Uncharacterized protein n=1 Tax=Eumeta variegata TaxID=151549 RepID=A0A4C1TIE9_EUMVA|nr:hypothetical protein EVAR_8271_1 [Eumeta japonica]
MADFVSCAIGRFRRIVAAPSALALKFNYRRPGGAQSRITESGAELNRRQQYNNSEYLHNSDDPNLAVAAADKGGLIKLMPIVRAELSAAATSFPLRTRPRLSGRICTILRALGVQRCGAAGNSDCRGQRSEIARSRVSSRRRTANAQLVFPLKSRNRCRIKDVTGDPATFKRKELEVRAPRSFALSVKLFEQPRVSRVEKRAAVGYIRFVVAKVIIKKTMRRSQRSAALSRAQLVQCRDSMSLSQLAYPLAYVLFKRYFSNGFN